MREVDWGRVGRFAGLVLGGSVVMGGLAAFLGSTLGPLGFRGVVLLSGWVPFVAAALLGGGRDLSQTVGLERPNRWVLVAWLVPLVLLFPIAGLGVLFGGGYSRTMNGMLSSYGAVLPSAQIAAIQVELAGLPVHPALLALPLAAIAGLTVNAVLAFGEEAGWRGWLLRELEPLGCWWASLVTGALWGLWHVPIVLQGHGTDGHPLFGVGATVALCVVLSPVLTWFTRRSGSVVGAAVFHGTLDAGAGLPLLVVDRLDDRWVGVTGVSGILVYLGVSVLLGSTGLWNGHTRDP